METKLIVGNLADSVSDSDLEAEFAKHGEVLGAVVVRDEDSGRSRGFGFVEMASEEMARSAIRAVDGIEIGGRRVWVNRTEQEGGSQRRSEIGQQW
jgi:RNA recognition motif-containing protein